MHTEQGEIHGSIYTVVVNWNLAAETAACVESLQAAGAPPGQIIVVDNGSTDGSAAHLRRALGGSVDLLVSEHNLGFAGGNNLGIERALAQDARWVLLANNDTRVDPLFFAELTHAIVEHPAYLILAPLILHYDEPDRIWSLGDRFIPGTLITRGLWRDRRVPDALPPLIPVDVLNACGLLVHRRVFEQIGLFDTGFFMYGEDVDLCWRARQAGFRLAAATRARMWHKVSRSTGPHHPLNRYWRISSQARFYRRAARGWQLPTMFLFTLARSARLAVLDLLHGRGTLAATTVRAWMDGWLGLTPAPRPGGQASTDACDV